MSRSTTAASHSHFASASSHSHMAFSFPNCWLTFVRIELTTLLLAYILPTLMHFRVGLIIGHGAHSSSSSIPSAWRLLVVVVMSAIFLLLIIVVSRLVGWVIVIFSRMLGRVLIVASKLVSSRSTAHLTSSSSLVVIVLFLFVARIVGLMSMVTLLPTHWVLNALSSFVLGVNVFIASIRSISSTSSNWWLLLKSSIIKVI